MTAEIILQQDPFDVSLDNPFNEQIFLDFIRRETERLMSLTMDSEYAKDEVTSCYNKARECKKELETMRKQLVEPFRSKINAINDAAKKISDPLDNLILVLNKKTNEYTKILEEKKRQNDEALKAAAALFDAEIDLYIPPMEATVRGDGAIIVTKVEKSFRVKNMATIPLKYLMVDEKAVKQAIKLGITEIPGLEIYEEKTTQLRKR